MKDSEHLKGTGGRLKIIREQVGVSREDMARRLGLSWPAYYKSETGFTFPRAAVLKRLESEYDISMDWLMFGKGAMNYKKERARVASLEMELETVKMELEAAKKELEKEREAAEATKRESALKVAGLTVTPELKALLEHMERVPLLYHEVMIHFERFKMNSRNTVETVLPDSQS